MDEMRRHRPLHGGGCHLKPDEPRALFEWDGFICIPVGTAPDLATGTAWANEPPPSDDSDQ